MSYYIVIFFFILTTQQLNLEIEVFRLGAIKVVSDLCPLDGLSHFFP